LSRTIFYIDDDVVCLNIFQEMFGNEYDVRTATTLSVARQMLAAQPADIIISDQSMPEISGTEFLAEVAKLYPSSYRIMLTGTMIAGEALPEILAGIIQTFLPKPWNRQNMEYVLERASWQIEVNRNRHD
jgi:DNA-binding NtrC family response regulator